MKLAINISAALCSVSWKQSSYWVKQYLIHVQGATYFVVWTVHKTKELSVENLGGWPLQRQYAHVVVKCTCCTSYQSSFICLCQATYQKRFTLCSQASSSTWIISGFPGSCHGKPYPQPSISTLSLDMDQPLTYAAQTNVSGGSGSYKFSYPPTCARGKVISSSVCSSSLSVCLSVCLSVWHLWVPQKRRCMVFNSPGRPVDTMARDGYGVSLGDLCQLCMWCYKQIIYGGVILQIVADCIVPGTLSYLSCMAPIWLSPACHVWWWPKLLPSMLGSRCRDGALPIRWDLCFHASSLLCLRTFWHTIPTSFCKTQFALSLILYLM